MSHLQERAEKNCLNCNAQVEGRYCHVCGQENVETKESVWHLVNHFFQDITHFDGKFFSSMKWLITKPGLLSAEYVRGRRMSYLNPIRMYVFSSAIFFLVFFKYTSSTENQGIRVKEDDKTTLMQKLEKKLKANEKELATTIRDLDSTSVEDIKELGELKVQTDKIKTVIGQLKLDSNAHIDVHELLKEDRTIVHFWKHQYETIPEYDAWQASLPEGRRDGSFIRNMTHKAMEINAKFSHDPKEFLNEFKEHFLHSLPKMLFVSLPLFALVLKLLYWRRKEFYYVSHGIFTIHLYIFNFILLMVMFGINALSKALHAPFLLWLNFVLFGWTFFYLYKALRVFYGQSRGKTILKFFLLNGIQTFILIVLFLVFLFLSLAQL